MRGCGIQAVQAKNSTFKINSKKLNSARKFSKNGNVIIQRNKNKQKIKNYVQ